MTLLKALFCGRGLSAEVGLLAHSFLFGGIAFGGVGLPVLSWLCYTEFFIVAALFFVVIFILVFNLARCIYIDTRTLRCWIGWMQLVSS
jgi:hypothetical protein